MSILTLCGLFTGNVWLEYKNIHQHSRGNEVSARRGITLRKRSIKCRQLVKYQHCKVKYCKLQIAKLSCQGSSPWNIEPGVKKLNKTQATYTPAYFFKNCIYLTYLDAIWCNFKIFIWMLFRGPTYVRSFFFFKILKNLNSARIILLSVKFC